MNPSQNELLGEVEGALLASPSQLSPHQRRLHIQRKQTKPLTLNDSTDFKMPRGLGQSRYVEYGCHCFGASQASPLYKRIDLEMPLGFHCPDGAGGCGRSP